ncbi:26S protease regulatory subunit [Nonomuraea terrae]|uniref:26S protease regulatory subunit n=1 Tax=Nonomuraea terrae TaxID=2530383 RepID=A0A4R4YH68_9ACTN|nr:ATP-binding protein [Nonomuraea terrae]TDD44208.1 26S protease regulatory subunit [Nonomuraea terrae]
MDIDEGEITEKRDGFLIKVVSVLEDGQAFLGRTTNGNSVRLSLGGPVDLARGDVVLAGDDWWERMPADAWADESLVGIVRRILDDGIVIEVGTVMRLLRGAPSLPVVLGNTVEFNEIDGITRIISDTPLRFRNEGVDDENLKEYLVERNESSPLTFESFGGYREVRNRAVELIETQLNKRENLLKIGARPIKGVLFTGPPGTGKTHLARIIASESKAAFFLVSGPSIVSKWLGDSEDTLRRIFAAAESEPRAIIFFDEIDSIAEKRTDDSHEASKRLVAQLLTLLDGFDQRSSNVVVIAATNRIDNVDEALLRPGRFDWEIEFELPTVEDRLEILQVDAERKRTIGKLPLQDIAEMTEGWSGARLASLWTEAALIAAGDDRSSISDEDLAQAFERVNRRPTREVKEGNEKA